MDDEKKGYSQQACEQRVLSFLLLWTFLRSGSSNRRRDESRTTSVIEERDGDGTGVSGCCGSSEEPTGSALVRYHHTATSASPRTLFPRLSTFKHPLVGDCLSYVSRRRVLFFHSSRRFVQVGTTTGSTQHQYDVHSIRALCDCGVRNFAVLNKLTMRPQEVLSTDRFGTTRYKIPPYSRVIQRYVS